ncbi:MAG: SUMF1/EgtB/PvdO family nonheme iron enzyme, partial [Chloroflexi bacterium]|nr:SUMF1/EgtB/PvdO family nonheme iron enzyme [Chloroflexota bacterium]
GGTTRSVKSLSNLATDGDLLGDLAQRLRALNAALSAWNHPEEARDERYPSTAYHYLLTALNCGSRSNRRLDELRALTNVSMGAAPLLLVREFGNRFLPNPLSYALEPDLWAGQMVIAPFGYVHGDLNPGNILCRVDDPEEIFLIDFSRHEPRGPLFFDLAYLELELIVRRLHDQPGAEWKDLLDAVTADRLFAGAGGQSAQRPSRPYARCTYDDCVLPVREQVKALINAGKSAHGVAEQFEIAWWIAACAAGLVLTRREGWLGQPRQRLAFLYAAYALERALDLLGLLPGNTEYTHFDLTVQSMAPTRAVERAYAEAVLDDLEDFEFTYVDLAGTQAAVPLNAPTKRRSRLTVPRDRAPRVALPLTQLPEGTLTGARKPLENIRAAMRAEDRVLLLGEPGSGKTTTLLRLFYDYAQDLTGTPGALIPVFVPLARYRGQSADDFREFTRECLADFSPELAESFDWLWAHDRLVLLCDALNEMPRESQETLAGLQATLANVKHTAVSCRVKDFTNDDLKEAGRFAIVEIRDLTPPLMQAIITGYRYQRNADEAWVPLTEEQQDGLWVEELRGSDNLLAAWDVLRAAGHADAFWRDERPPGNILAWWDDNREEARRVMLSDPKGLMLLCRNPYMLFLVIEIYRVRGGLSGSRGALFADFVATLMEREGLAAISDDGTVTLTAAGKALNAALVRLAEVMQLQRGQTDITHDEALELLGGEAHLRLAAQCSLVYETSAAVRFSHQLVQEYFASQQMVADIDAGRLANTYWPPERWWERTGREQTALILAGVIGLAKAVAWLAPAQPELALDCVEEARGQGGMADSDLQALMIAGAHAKIGDPDNPVGCAAAYRVLGRLNADDRKGVGVIKRASIALPDIDWVEIPAGAFLMGSDKALDAQADDNELPQRHVKLPTFWITRYPVTYAQYEAFVAAGGYHERGYWTDAGWEWKGANTQPELCWNDPIWHISNHPVVGITWYEADAYTRWLNMVFGDSLRPIGTARMSGLEIRLPTEAEWEKAARGWDGRIYPYGNRFDTANGNTSATDIERTCAVGIFPEGASPYGLLDMSGNVWEWCLTHWRDSYTAPADNQAEGKARRVLRGGSWFSNQSSTRVAGRFWLMPLNRDVNLGFRVVVGSVPV